MKPGRTVAVRFILLLVMTLVIEVFPQTTGVRLSAWRSATTTGTSPNFGVTGVMGEYASGEMSGVNYSMLFGTENLIGVIVSANEEHPLIPLSTDLFQNYPNPFNPVTTIKFTLKNVSRVELVVYDMLGAEVQRLVDEEKPAGEYKIPFNGTGLASGVYIYRLVAGDFVSVKKLVLLK